MSDFTYDAFISYSHRDSDWVHTWLLPGLEKAGLKVCIDDRDFELGVPSIINMENAVKNSRKTTLVMTPNWTESEWTDFEAILTQAGDPVGRRRRLVPIMLEKCDLPDRLAIFTYADFTDPAQQEAQLARVVSAIRVPTTPNTSAQLAPNLVHPYPLQANFTGRVSERQELTAWLADDPRPICALVAMGGMGKSALSWYWVMKDVLPDPVASKVEGVMWWSFYEGESSFAKFVDEALKYVSGQPIDTGSLPTTHDRAQELLRQLQAKRVLFVFDGFERQLRTYARLDAAYQQDDAADTSHDARACVDPIAARLLANIAASPTRAKILLTTRLMVQDLEDSTGDPLAGVLKRELEELPRADAGAFMRAQGVTKGTFAEIAAVCDDYGNHPLSLRLLSGLIKRDKKTAGDIAAAPRHDVHGSLVQRQHHILEQSYDALLKEESILLSRIAAFRGPMTYDALTIFNEFGGEAKFDAALDELQERGLIQHDTKNNRYDLHPIVRRYAYDRLTDKTGVHTRLRDYFAKTPVPDENKVQSIEDLLPVIELYHHTARSGQYDEAVILLKDKLVPDPLYFRFAAYQLVIELCRALFPGGDDQPPRLKDERAQSWVMNILGGAYAFSGLPRRALRLVKLKNTSDERQENKADLAAGLGNIATQQIVLGELATAEQSLQRGIELCREMNNKHVEASGHRDLGRVHVHQGAFAEAEQEFNTAFGLFEGARNFPRFGTVWADRALYALMRGDSEAAVEAARQSRLEEDEVARKYYPVERDIIRAEWLLGAALVMEGKDLNAAALHLTDSLTRCRRINMVDHEPDILLAWARWHRARGNTRDAQANAEEALAIADRCEYRLKQAEIHNFLARLALDAGDREGARVQAEIARERAWCDGPPHCYKPALEEAEGMLRELGAKV